MDEAAIAEIRDRLGRARMDEDYDGIWPENVLIVESFMAVASQWRVVATGGGFVPSRLVWTGLDYAGARAGLDGAGIAVTPDLWDGIRTMERAAREILNGREG